MATLPKNKYALLIANTVYKDPGLRQLAAPGADVQALADVLGNPQIGAFEVKTVVNKAWWMVQRAIALFFADRDPEDMLLLYFSCHGIKNDDGHLYFAVPDTNRKILRASAVPDDFVQEQMRTSRARRQVLILDCCYGGFFTNRMLTKSDKTVDDIDRFQESGAVILTGSNSIQYAFEGDGLKNESKLSVFTSSLVKGLNTGDADLDNDGMISATDLFGYARRQMRNESRTQTPTLSTVGQEGDIYIADVPRSRRSKKRVGSQVRPSLDGWIDLTRFVNRSPNATDRDACLVAMETSLAIHGRRVSLSPKDLRAKLQKLTRQKPARLLGAVMDDWVYVIDHVGIQAERSKKVYTARSLRLRAHEDIPEQLRLGRPVIVGVTWRTKWLEEPILKTGKIEPEPEDQDAGGSIITIVGYNEEDMSIRFMWRLDWGNRGLGWMTRQTAKGCFHGGLYSIEAAEITMPYTQR